MKANWERAPPQGIPESSGLANCSQAAARMSTALPRHQDVHEIRPVIACSDKFSFLDRKMLRRCSHETGNCRRTDSASTCASYFSSNQPGISSLGLPVRSPLSETLPAISLLTSDVFTDINQFGLLFLRTFCPTGSRSRQTTSTNSPGFSHSKTSPSLADNSLSRSLSDDYYLVSVHLKSFFLVWLIFQYLSKRSR